MCTVSWSLGADGLSLAFSRDERKSRPAASAPRLVDGEGPQVIAPVDPQSGGSWIAANEHGLCCFLLNNYAALASTGAGIGSKKSRGSIPLCLARRADAEQAEGLIHDLDLGEYPPFLVGVANESRVAAWASDCASLSPLDTTRGLLTTSSYKTEAVQAYREARYRVLAGQGEVPAKERRRQFHMDLHNADPAFNPLMLREDSRTHSLTEVSIGADLVSMRYAEVVADTRRLSEGVEKALLRVG